MQAFLGAVGIMGTVVSIVWLIYCLVKKKEFKKSLLALVICLVLLIIALCLPDSEKDDPSYPSIKILTEATDLDDEQAKAVFKDFKSVGIDELKSCKYKSEEKDVKKYEFECNKCKGVLEIKDKKTSLIKSGYIYLFTSHGAVRNINDYYIDDDKKFELLTVVEKSVKKYLKSPSSAKFPDQVWDSGDWEITRNKNNVTVKSHVDSQNDFGAMIRTNFTCQLSYDKGEVLYLSINGEDVFGTLVKNS